MTVATASAMAWGGKSRPSAMPAMAASARQHRQWTRERDQARAQTRRSEKNIGGGCIWDGNRREADGQPGTERHRWYQPRARVWLANEKPKGKQGQGMRRNDQRMQQSADEAAHQNQNARSETPPGKRNCTSSGSHGNAAAGQAREQAECDAAEVQQSGGGHETDNGDSIRSGRKLRAMGVAVKNPKVRQRAIHSRGRAAKATMRPSTIADRAMHSSTPGSGIQQLQ